MVVNMKNKYMNRNMAPSLPPIFLERTYQKNKFVIIEKITRFWKTSPAKPRMFVSTRFFLGYFAVFQPVLDFVALSTMRK